MAPALESHPNVLSYVANQGLGFAVSPTAWSSAPSPARTWWTPREAAEAGFDVLIACAFNYDAGASEFAKLGALSVLKARMNADLHMAEDLKNTGKGNLFVVFGEPDIAVEEADSGQLCVRVTAWTSAVTPHRPLRTVSAGRLGRARG